MDIDKYWKYTNYNIELIKKSKNNRSTVLIFAVEKINYFPLLSNGAYYGLNGTEGSPRNTSADTSSKLVRRPFSAENTQTLRPTRN